MKFKKSILCLAAFTTFAASSLMADKLQINSNLQGDIYVTCSPGVTMAKDGLIGTAVAWDLVGTVFLKSNTDSTCTFYLGDSTANEIGSAQVHIDFQNNQGTVENIIPFGTHTFEGPTVADGTTSVTILS